MVTDGGAIVLHCSHRTQATNGNDHCSWDIISVKSMKLSADDVKVYDEINVLDPERRTIATTWNLATCAFFLEREEHYKLS